MKAKLIAILLFSFTISHSQTIDHIFFDYDAAGNQIKRYTVDIDPGRNSNQEIKDVKDLTDEDLKKADIYDDIKYYPNPVKEELFVKWENNNENHVTRIELYSMTGQLIRSYNDLENVESTTISFSSYPEGFYNLLLIYSNEENKSLKIVKK